jgi:glycosyltransferase involved in cell wall biosynthesis
LEFYFGDKLTGMGIELAVEQMPIFAKPETSKHLKILHTVEFYHPSVGGAQEVVRQLSERLVQHEHEVTVATTYLPARKEQFINGVRIEEFDIWGNAVDGIRGEAERYQRFLIESQFDIMMNYAAQEWTMDLVFPILEQIPYRKVMIPCGFSALYNPAFQEYFSKMPEIMRKYDHLVFHADHYRDIDFARQHNINHYSIIPNGASQAEFEVVDNTFRRRYSIPENEPLLLTVGGHTGQKGHRLCMEALGRLKNERATLIIIGNIFHRTNFGDLFLRPLLHHFRYLRLFEAIKLIAYSLLGGVHPGCLSECRSRATWINLRQRGKKRVLLLDPPRQDVIAAYHAADLFVFGSNIEYSPLVLFEALASRTPFVSLACGNAAEIAAWSQGGIIAPTFLQENRYVDSTPDEFTSAIASLLNDEKKRAGLADTGHRRWLEKFTWEQIVLEYEDLYQRLLVQRSS